MDPVEPTSEEDFNELKSTSVFLNTAFYFVIKQMQMFYRKHLLNSKVTMLFSLTFMEGRLFHFFMA